jgi:hypothetical protein
VTWTPPTDTAITLEDARRLLSGNLGQAYREIIRGCCVPLFWYRLHGPRAGPILHNGTLTLLRTPERLLGVTAAHVVRQYQTDHAVAAVRLQAGNALLENPVIIDVSPHVDLATFALRDQELAQMGKETMPLSGWPPMLPEEGRGILLGGYPADERRETAPTAAIGDCLRLSGLPAPSSGRRSHGGSTVNMRWEICHQVQT